MARPQSIQIVTWSVDWILSRKLSLKLGPDELNGPLVVREEEGGGESIPFLADANVDVLIGEV